MADKVARAIAIEAKAAAAAAGAPDMDESLKRDGTVIGDGVTVDGPAIAARITAINASKKKINVPSGTYKFSQKLTTNGAVIRGGVGTKFLSTQGSSATDFNISGTGTVMEDIEIESPASIEVFSAQGGSKKYRLQRVTITGDGHGVHINSSGQEDILIQNMDISTRQYGILLNFNSKGKCMRILNSNIYSRDADAVELNNPQSSTPPESYDGFKQVFVMGNLLTADLFNGAGGVNSGFGFGIAHTHEVIGIGNIVDRARARGLHIEDAQENVLIVGNIFIGNLIDGAWIIDRTGAQPVIVTNNYFIKAKDAVQQTGHGIWRIYDAHGCLWINVSHNYIKGFYEGLCLDGPQSAIVDGCIIENCAVGIRGRGQYTGTVSMRNVPTLLQVGNGCSVDYVKSLTPHTTTMEFTGTSGTQGAKLYGLSSLTNPVATPAGSATKITLFKLPTRFNARVTATIDNITGKWLVVSADVAWDGTDLTMTNILRNAFGNISLADNAAPFVNNAGGLALNLFTGSVQTVVVNYDFKGLYYLNTVLGPDNTPVAPTGLTATPSSTQATLSWAAVGGATSYNVKRSTVSGGPYTTVGSPTTSTYTDTGLTDGTVYYYVVSAVNSAGESLDTAQVSAAPVPPVGVPTVPAGLSATALDGSISLTWNAAANGPLTYTIKRGLVPGGPYTNITTGVVTPTYTDTGRTNGTAYYYVVSATNINGESANSSEVTATPAVPTAIFSDNFNRANNATDPGYALGWESNTTNWGIVNNTVKQVTHTAVNDYLTYKSTVSNGVVSATFLHPTNNQRLIFRRQDSANEWMVDIQSNNYLLRKRVGNTVTTVADLGTTPVNGDLVSVRLNGSSIKVFINGVEKTPSTLTDTALQTLKEHGFSAGSTNAVGEWDDFSITGL